MARNRTIKLCSHWVARLAGVALLLSASMAQAGLITLDVTGVTSNGQLGSDIGSTATAQIANAGVAPGAEEVADQIQAAVENAEGRMKTPGDPLNMFAHAYADLPPHLQAQREELAADYLTAGQIQAAIDRRGVRLDAIAFVGLGHGIGPQPLGRIERMRHRHDPVRRGLGHLVDEIHDLGQLVDRIGNFGVGNI